MAGQLKQQIYSDYSKGTWEGVSDRIAPENSLSLGLNLDTDYILGYAVSRLGTTIIGSQLVDNKPILGLHNYRQSVGSTNKVFAAISDGSNNDIYDVVAGTKSLEDDTADLKTRFLTYLDSCLRLNGTDAAKQFNGSSWLSANSATCTANASTNFITSAGHGLSNGYILKFSTTTTLPAGLSTNTAYFVINKTTDTFQVSLTSGGSAVDITDTGTGTHTWEFWDTFDLVNFPSGAKYAVEFRDRVYVAGDANNPDRVDISGIADSTNRVISWTDDNRFIVFEQEDGGGGITGLAKVPNYLLVFKKRTLKRYDGQSAFPEDMIGQGAPSQEAITVADGVCYWVNENGMWASTGGRPKKISTFSVDNIIKSCSSENLQNVALCNDEEHIFASFKSVTVDGETQTNIVIKYNIFQNTFDVRQYPTLQRVFTRYVDTDDNVFTIFGDDDGTVLKIDTGSTDNGTAITYSFVTQDLNFGLRMYIKAIKRFGVISENAINASILYRTTNSSKDWKPAGIIKSNVTDINDVALRGNFFNFKITNSISSGRAIIKGMEFPAGIEVYDTSEE